MGSKQEAFNRALDRAGLSCDFCGGTGRVPSAAIGVLAGTPDNKTDPCGKCFGTGLKLEK